MMKKENIQNFSHKFRIFLISFLFIIFGALCVKSSAYATKYENIKTALTNSQKLSELDTDFDITNIMKEDIDFNNMNELFGLLTNEISYSYLAWKYFKIFGENSKNFEDNYNFCLVYK